MPLKFMSLAIACEQALHWVSCILGLSDTPKSQILWRLAVESLLMAYFCNCFMFDQHDRTAASWLNTDWESARIHQHHHTGTYRQPGTNEKCNYVNFFVSSMVQQVMSQMKLVKPHHLEPGDLKNSDFTLSVSAQLTILRTTITLTIMFTELWILCPVLPSVFEY